MTATVSSTLMSVDMTIAMVQGYNLIKPNGTGNKLLPWLAQMLDSMRKDNPTTIKKFPIKVNIPEYLSLCSLQPGASRNNKAITDLTLIAFYYLLQVREYTIKQGQNNTKQTVQFWLTNITFFKKDGFGTLCQLP